jgi:hypothetical protein
MILLSTLTLDDKRLLILFFACEIRPRLRLLQTDEKSLVGTPFLFFSRTEFAAGCPTIGSSIRMKTGTNLNPSSKECANMKFCPYCGASLVGAAVSFCAECGERLPSASKSTTPTRGTSSHSDPTRESTVGQTSPSGAGKSARSAPPPRNRHSKGWAVFRTRLIRQHPEPLREPIPDPRDEGYDGYYDDVKPVDDGRIRDRTDPELVKRITVVSASAIVVVILSMIFMYLL